MDNLKTQGISMPRLGLGTFRMQGDECRAAVESALSLGYRHIDTAEMYANEEAIGMTSTHGVAFSSISGSDTVNRSITEGRAVEVFQTPS